MTVKEKWKKRNGRHGNRTHDFLGRFKGENLKEIKERLWGLEPTNLRPREREFIEKKIKESEILGVRSHIPLIPLSRTLRGKLRKN